MKERTMKKLINGDMREELLKLQEEGIVVDAIITDPPYNVGYKYNSYKDNMHTEDYMNLFILISEFSEENKSNISIMHYPTDAVKYFTQTIGIPDTITTWVYNSNTPKQQRLIFNYGNFYRNQVRQPYKNPTDKRIKERISNGKVDAKAYDW